jgi:hypothetical protein
MIYCVLVDVERTSDEILSYKVDSLQNVRFDRVPTESSSTEPPVKVIHETTIVKNDPFSSPRVVESPFFNRQSDELANHNSDKSIERNTKTSDVSHSKKSDSFRWLYPGLIVKITTKKLNPSLYSKKGVILDVYGSNVASVRLESSSQIYENIKQKHLETVVPHIRHKCVILAGKYKFLEAVVLEKKSEENTVIVQLVEEMDIVCELSMDEVCAFQSDLFHH